MFDVFAELWDNIFNLFTSVRWNDILDILIITTAIFSLIKLFRKSRAIHLLRGFVLLGVLYLVVSLLDLPTTGFVFGKLFSNIVVILVLLFQPEIRHAVEMFGRGRINLSSFFRRNSTAKIKKINADISAIVNACINMSEDKTGALIVIEGKSPLADIKASGSVVDAAINVPVIENIFFPKAPLHDGAMVITNGRIAAAGCILPLTEKTVARQLGTRHRAAIGLSEETDALVIVVSEETGQISVAKGGLLGRDMTSATLVDELNKYLLPKDEEKEGE